MTYYTRHSCTGCIYASYAMCSLGHEMCRVDIDEHEDDTFVMNEDNERQNTREMG